MGAMGCLVETGLCYPERKRIVVMLNGLLVFWTLRRPKIVSVVSRFRFATRNPQHPLADETQAVFEPTWDDESVILPVISHAGEKLVLAIGGRTRVKSWLASQRLGCHLETARSTVSLPYFLGGKHPRPKFCSDTVLAACFPRGGGRMSSEHLSWGFCRCLRRDGISR